MWSPHGVVPLRFFLRSGGMGSVQVAGAGKRLILGRLEVSLVRRVIS
jgi:hypothetical protein